MNKNTHTQEIAINKDKMYATHIDFFYSRKGVQIDMLQLKRDQNCSNYTTFELESAGKAAPR